MILQMDKSRQEKMELRRKQENAQLNKLLLWFAAAFGFEVIALFVKRFLINYNQSSLTEIRLALALSKILMVLQFVAPVLLAAAVVWAVCAYKKEKPWKLPLILAGVFAGLSVLAIGVYQSRTTGMTFVSALPLVIAVLAFVYFLYQREFFFSTVLCGMGVFALWFYRRAFAGRAAVVIALFVVLLVVLACAAVLLRKLSGNGGMWKTRRILPDKTDYRPAYLSIGLTALALLAALVGGATVAYYAIYVLIIWLFCMVVYYTVRMM